ncbi:hypothetical protein RUM44_006773 [Polyplax serrata]|uniref:Uncharacterized protein n=1 Tax=Polyplax serrata TaxID=468196 RepID=A0ABR1AJ18_POLSC
MKNLGLNDETTPDLLIEDKEEIVTQVPIFTRTKRLIGLKIENFSIVSRKEKTKERKIQEKPSGSEAKANKVKRRSGNDNQEMKKRKVWKTSGDDFTFDLKPVFYFWGGGSQRRMPTVLSKRGEPPRCKTFSTVHQIGKIVGNGEAVVRKNATLTDFMKRRRRD